MPQPGDPLYQLWLRRFVLGSVLALALTFKVSAPDAPPAGDPGSGPPAAPGFVEPAR